MAVDSMITSKDILKKTGISRATLNNYIKLGILPKPVVGPPRPGDKAIKQIGYFPEEAVGCIERVRQLKSRGLSMAEISRIFRDETPADGFQPVSSSIPARFSSAGGKDAADPEPQSKAHLRASSRQLSLTVGDMSAPAYLINRNFEVEWINPQAMDLVFNTAIPRGADRESRNIFRLFIEQRNRRPADEWTALVSLHLTILQRHLSETLLGGIYKGISREEAALLTDLFRSRIPAGEQEDFFRLPIAFTSSGGGIRRFWVHSMTFREGTFLAYVPEDALNCEISALFGQRERVLSNLPWQRAPSLVSLCVLIADLQDSVRISAELLPSEYFELINQLWECLGPAFANHKGIFGKHLGDGIVYYFPDQPGGNYIIDCISCAMELRETMKLFSNKWKGLKGWDNDLFLNTGINEGQEFFGPIRSAGNLEFTALGDTINIAARLTEFSRNGEIWTTKHLISKLSREERNMFLFGIHSRKRPGRGFIRNSFCRLGDLVTEDNPHFRRLNELGGLPITEIKGRLHRDFA